ncbi:MAG: ribosomal protein S18-alanine N-acetyltransferase [Clostridia bacterium]|nr:ribosomal protein S18-alanine N-acetyltransferase [Clostridia bacterium]
MRRLVVCTGNTCRSPMAKCLVEAYQAPGDEVQSAGLSTTGAAASVHAVLAMREKGYDLSFHKSTLITPQMVAWADEIGVMTPAHKVAVTSLFDIDPDKVIVLGKGIPDPFGLSLTDYRFTRDILEKAVKEWLSPDKLHVVAMTERHVPALAAIERDSFDAPWSEDALSEELQNPCAKFLVAEQHGEVLGYLGTHVVADEMAVANVAVAPAHRRKGVAKALLDAAKRTAEIKDLSRITLEVRVSNTAAIALYEQAGFVRDGIRPSFYSHPTEDAAIYSFYRKGDTA